MPPPGLGFLLKSISSELSSLQIVWQFHPFNSSFMSWLLHCGSQCSWRRIRSYSLHIALRNAMLLCMPWILMDRIRRLVIGLFLDLALYLDLALCHSSSLSCGL